MLSLAIFLQSNTVQKVSQYFVSLGQSGQWWYFTIQALLFYYVVFQVIRILVINHTLKPISVSNRINPSDWLFIISSLVFILISKFPHAIEGVLNPDEAQWIAVAKTVNYDPRFWVSVDTGTGGPLVPSLLLLLKLLGLPIDHGSIKILGAFILSLSVCFIYLFFRIVLGNILARIFHLLLMTEIAFLDHPDLVAYNSEHAVVLLISFSLFLLAKIYKAETINQNYIIVLGLSLGLVPLAKLQGGPIAAIIGLGSIYLIVKNQTSKIKHLGFLAGGALFPTIAMISIVWLYGGLTDFYTSYIQQNLIYTSRKEIISDTISSKIELLKTLLFRSYDTAFFFHWCFILSFFGVMIIFSVREKIKKANVEKIVFSIVLFLISCYCVVAPYNFFDHYVFLIIIPAIVMAALISAVAFDFLLKKNNKYLIKFHRVYIIIGVLFIFVTSFYYFQSKFNYHPSYLDQAPNRANGYVLFPETTNALQEYFFPGERMAIWGWASSLYETTDFLMGTRDAATPFQIEKIPLQKYFIDRYIYDLTINKPLLFVETIGSQFFAYNDRSVYGFENYPKVKSYIDRHYDFEMETGGARIFIRKDYFYKNTLDFKVDKEPNANDEYLGVLDRLEPFGSHIKFEGWTVLGENIHEQKVKILLTRGDTTIALNCQTYDRPDVAEHFKKDSWTMSGYKAFVDRNEISEGEYKIKLYIENGEKLEIIDLNRAFNLTDF